jgi:nitroreductase
LPPAQIRGRSQNTDMTDGPTGTAADRVRPLVRVRQIRGYTNEPVTDDELAALGDAARWSGSSANQQPWRFIVIRDRKMLDALHKAGMPQTRSLETAPAAIVVVLPEDERGISRAYDEGRAVERIMIAAKLLGLAAGISWVKRVVAPVVGELLGLPSGHFGRTIVAVGHPSEAALAPKALPGEARLPREQVIFEERWPAD